MNSLLKRTGCPIFCGLWCEDVCGLSFNHMGQSLSTTVNSCPFSLSGSALPALASSFIMSSSVHSRASRMKQGLCHNCPAVQPNQPTFPNFDSGELSKFPRDDPGFSPWPRRPRSRWRSPVREVRPCTTWLRTQPGSKNSLIWIWRVSVGTSGADLYTVDHNVQLLCTTNCGYHQLYFVPKIFSNQPALPFTFHSVSEVVQDNLFDLVLAHVKPCTFDNFFQLKTRQRLGARFWLDTARPNKATGQVWEERNLGRDIRSNRAKPLGFSTAKTDVHLCAESVRE